MNVRKFIAATARDALHKVKEMLGPDAIILSNRAIPGGVEIMAVAAGEMDAIVTSPRAAAAPASVPAVQEDYTVRLSSEAVPSNRVANPIPPLTSRPAPQFEPANIAVPRAAEVVPAEVMAEIRALRRIVEQHLAGAAWGETARREPVKTEILRQMLDAGFSPRLAHELLAELPLVR